MKATKSYSFYCKDLNEVKYNLLHQKAIELRDFRNSISQEVCENIAYFSNLSKFEWINYFRIRLPHCNNQDISKAIEDVFVSYENKFSTLKTQIQFKVQGKIVKTFYKRNTKNNKKGDVKSFEVKLKSTKLTKIMTYLTRYWNENMLVWLKENKDKDPKKKELRNDAYNLLMNYGDKVISIIESRRARVIKRITKHPIHFHSLSFRSCNEITSDLLNRNKNLHSIFGCLITLGGQKTENGKLYIPVKYNEEHHEEIESYGKSPRTNGRKQIAYTICFQPKNKIRIILSREAEEETTINKTNYLGVDVNVKHNLFSTSLGDDIDYDRKLFNDYVKFLQKLDQKHQNKIKYNQDTTLSNKDKIKKDKWLTRITDMLKRKSRLLVDYAKLNNKDHIALEDLSVFDKGYSRNEEFEGFKYSRLTRLLNLSSIKHIVSSIANKNNIQVSFVQSHYTSQTCECGCISQSNRKTQEMFSCVDCGRELNADHNSALNIEKRLSSKTLRDKLLLNKNGVYKPKKLGKNSIKNILYDYYTGLSSDKMVVE